MIFSVRQKNKNYSIGKSKEPVPMTRQIQPMTMEE
jgi:hypothetical protein